jgi:hypothetical protein
LITPAGNQQLESQTAGDKGFLIISRSFWYNERFDISAFQAGRTRQNETLRKPPATHSAPPFSTPCL